MSETPDILTAEQMKCFYGSFYDRSPRLHLDQRKVPERFWPLMAYAEFWGISDDLTREILVKEAPGDVQLNLKKAVGASTMPWTNGLQDPSQITLILPMSTSPFLPWGWQRTMSKQL